MKNNKPNDWNKLEESWKNLEKGELEFEPTQEELKAISPIVKALSDWEEPVLKPREELKSKIFQSVNHQTEKKNKNTLWLVASSLLVAASVFIVFLLIKPNNQNDVNQKEISLNEPVIHPSINEMNDAPSPAVENKPTESIQIPESRGEDKSEITASTHIPTVTSIETFQLEENTAQNDAAVEKPSVLNFSGKENSVNESIKQVQIVSSKVNEDFRAISTNQLSSIDNWEKMVVTVY
jgi:hypothetical protein